jgi:hypothetical protein
MSEWERDPEGETLRWLDTQVPRLRHEVMAALVQLETRPAMLFSLCTLQERELWAVAYAYNNLMALYERGAPRKVATDRFVRTAPMALPAANAACAVHTAEYLAAATAGRLIVWNNSWTLEYDRAHAWMPHDKTLQDIMRVFEAFLHFHKTLRLAEIVRASGTEVVIVDRLFANVAQYQRFVESYGRALAWRQHAARRRLGCAECCPCVATATLSNYPRDPTFRLPYVWEDSEKVMPLWFEASRAITSHKVSVRSLERVQNAVLWFFSYTPDPLGAFFPRRRQPAARHRGRRRRRRCRRAGGGRGVVCALLGPPGDGAQEAGDVCVAGAACGPAFRSAHQFIRHVVPADGAVAPWHRCQHARA